MSAILEASHQIQRLFELNDPDRGVTVNVGTIDGGSAAHARQAAHRDLGNVTLIREETRMLWTWLPLEQLALSWLVYRLTGSPLRVNLQAQRVMVGADVAAGASQAIAGKM